MIRYSDTARSYYSFVFLPKNKRVAVLAGIEPATFRLTAKRSAY